MAAEFGQSEDVWQSAISCGGGYFADVVACCRGCLANFIAYAGVNPEALVTRSAKLAGEFGRCSGKVGRIGAYPGNRRSLRRPYAMPSETRSIGRSGVVLR